MNLLILFAPVFREFGCDVSHALERELKDEITIHGICTGGSGTTERVREGLGSLGGKLWDLNAEEKDWLENDTDDEIVLDILFRVNEPGAFGRILTSDRRIGQGLVSGGHVTSSLMGERALSKPQIYPRRYVMNLVSFIERVLDETHPDAVFCYAVAGAPAVCLAELCSIRSIPFLCLVSARLGNRYLIDTDARGRLEPVAKVYMAAQNSQIDLSPWINSSREELQKFRENPTPPEYEAFNNTKRAKEKLLPEIGRALVRTGKIIVFKAARTVLRRSSTNVRRYPLKEAWKRVSIIWRRKKLQLSSPFSDHVPREYPFIYFPLHVNPEASTMVLSPLHTDQIPIIEALAKSAPPHFDIVVKEHAPMLGLRPEGFYKRIKQMPRVTLVGPEHNGLDLIRMSALTAVITGTAAWEAVRLKRPALVIGDSPYLSIGEGIIHSPCLSNLPMKIIEALNMPPASDTALILYLAAIYRESFEMKSSLLWGNYLNHSERERSNASRVIAQNILHRINSA